MTGRDAQPPSAVMAAWCACGFAGFLVLVDASAGLTILCLVIAGACLTWHRKFPPPAPRTSAPGAAVPLARGSVAQGHRPPGTPPAARPEQGQQLAALPGLAELAQLSDRQLCRAWRTSYVRLQRVQEVSDPAGTAHVSCERARYLDELQRRNPDGFEAWLIAGARAPSDPSRYLAKPVPLQRRPPQE